MTPTDLTFIGTATTLLRLGPFTLLTDPNFLHRGELAYLGYGLVSRRRTEPALQVDQLPPLDAVVLSHLHGDHWDRRASSGLDKAVPIVTTTHAVRRLRRDGFANAMGLQTWQQHGLNKDGYRLTVTSMPAVHATNRVVRALLPPVMGSLIELQDPAGASVVQVYVTGDTMPFDALEEIPRRHPDIDTAVVHIGGTTLPGGFVVTMTGAQGVDCVRRVGAKVAVPVHHDDFGVFKSGLDDFRAAAGAAPATDIRYVDRGATVSLTTASV